MIKLLYNNGQYFCVGRSTDTRITNNPYVYKYNYQRSWHVNMPGKRYAGAKYVGQRFHEYSTCIKIEY